MPTLSVGIACRRTSYKNRLGLCLSVYTEGKSSTTSNHVNMRRFLHLVLQFVAVQYSQNGTHLCPRSQEVFLLFGILVLDACMCGVMVRCPHTFYLCNPAPYLLHSAPLGSAGGSVGARGELSLAEVQCHLDREGASDLVIDLIMNATSDRIFQESILLAIALLEGGNPVIQVPYLLFCAAL